MKANETKVDKFLATNETTFAIPVYQRNYDWTSTQCRQLLYDIIETGKNDKINAHFIGSIVYVHDDVYTSSRIKELTIIDGQQRLTTLYILYKYLITKCNISAESLKEDEIELYHLTYATRKGSSAFLANSGYICVHSSFSPAAAAFKFSTVVPINTGNSPATGNVSP